MKRLALFAMLLPTTAFAQGGISLSWPIACKYGEECFVQNYVDEDTTTAARDYTCGPLTYDGHKGTDIRLKNEAAMHKGVNVLAAYEGTVRAVRDGMQDVNVKTIGVDAVKNRECGNGVVIDHSSGFETQYCHMMNGSIAVHQGDKVVPGTVLGKVGMSGDTEFPHLHFEVRRLGRVLDPFTAEPQGGACGGKHASLWKTTPDYISTALLGDGFTPIVPTPEQVRNLQTPITQLSRSSSAIVYWADIMGAKAGDVLSLTILSANGQVAVTRDVPMTRNLAQSFSYVGKKGTPEGLVPGTYKATLTLKRPGQDAPVLTHESTVEVPF